MKSSKSIRSTKPFWNIRHAASIFGALLLVPFVVLLAGAGQLVPDKVQKKAEPFSPEDVRLLDGPFKHAQDMDRAYLLSLDVDSLARPFRVTAGLPVTAKSLGGWEAADSEVRGHFIGHWLSACAEMYAATGRRSS